MKKFIFISVSILIFCSIISCESMDATYKDFVKDGPIMYLTRLSKDSITVRNGWERVLISFPIVKDGRSTKIALDRKSTRLNSSHSTSSRMPSSA